MAAPFAIPARVTRCPLYANWSAAVFFRVSVVMIAPANASNAAGLFCALLTTFGIAATIFSTGSEMPMIPVEEGKTRKAAVFNFLATSWQTVLAARRPGFPVAQLALPALTIKARAFPFER